MTGLYGPLWPVLLVGLIAAGLSVTAMSWHGVLLAETARLAPEGSHGAAIGGVLSFGQIGALVLPLAYAFVLSATGSHGVRFVACSLPALLVGIALLRPDGRQSQEG